MTLPFFFDLEGDGLDCFGGEEGVATCEGGWSDCLAWDTVTPNVVIYGEAIFFDDKERRDLGRD